MTRICLASAALLVAAVSAHAQTPATAPAASGPAASAPAAQQPQVTTISAGVKRGWDNIKRNVAEAAEKMPEANYSFKPTPDVRSFGELVGHVAESQLATCARLKGEQIPFERGSIEKKTAKADLVKAMQDSIAACDGAYTSTDEALVKMTKVGTNEIAPVTVLWGNISHTNEHYGNMVTYMRLKGLVPPSTERAQAPRKPS
jgi:uncharacterized damage-inducible protein DinB